MKRFHYVLVAAAALAVLACSEGPTTPSGEPSVLTLPQLVVSDAADASGAAEAAGSGSASAAASGADVAYVSLPPGALPQMVSVRIRNADTGEVTSSIPVVEGGFDPVPVAAVAGDELELTFTDGQGAVSVAHAAVPDRRAPVVVRTNPPGGRTDVALSIQPRVFFSEPIDPETLAAGVRLLTGGTEVTATVGLLLGEPWTAELVPASELEPGTTYELVVTTEVRDLDGDALAEEVRVDFRTTAPSDPGPSTTEATAIAMVSGSNQPGKAGVPLSDRFVVRVTDADGHGVEGVQVAWKIASGAGELWSKFHGEQYLCDSIDGCTDAGGYSYVEFKPTTIGTAAVTAEVEGLEGSPVTFTTDVTVMVIRFGQDWSYLGGWNDPPRFMAPWPVTVPVGTTVEFVIAGVAFNIEAWSGAAHIVSTAEPPGGESFDFGVGSCWESSAECENHSFEFVTDVPGTWEFEELLSGERGTLTAAEP